MHFSYYAPAQAHPYSYQYSYSYPYTYQDLTPVPCPWPPPVTRPVPVVVPYSTHSGPPPTPIKYQTLAFLLRDLHRLLSAPHEGREFHFVGTVTSIAEVFYDDSDGQGERELRRLEESVRRVAWEVVTRTAVAVSVGSLIMTTLPASGSSEPTALTAAASTAALTLLEPPPASSATTTASAAQAITPPCSNCVHTLEIQVTRVSRAEIARVWPWKLAGGAPTAGGKAEPGAERIVVGLKHVPGGSASAGTKATTNVNGVASSVNGANGSSAKGKTGFTETNGVSNGVTANGSTKPVLSKPAATATTASTSTSAPSTFRGFREWPVPTPEGQSTVVDLKAKAPMAEAWGAAIATPKRGRGRPRKVKKEEEVVVDEIEDVDMEKNDDDEIEVVEVRRSPRKSTADSTGQN
ncbi:hypothetical protein MKEN_00610600 [Mycena kentingensis (nom. inval.)]|nr:hypothetical protein MKEN_00610600 [Mycena kentingensis (nom. inval.)]